MKPEIKAAVTLICGIIALITANIDMVFIISCALGIVGVLMGRSALSGEITPSGRGIAAAGMLSCTFAVCVAFGAILGYTIAYFL